MNVAAKPMRPPPKREPAHVSISRKLGVAIVTGVYEPGAILPGEIEMAEDLGVSRSVVREALRMLTGKGLIDSKPKLGTRVKAREDWNLLDPMLLEWMFEKAPTRDFVNALFELRMIVEPAAAELAATRRTARQVSVMGHALEVMAQHSLSAPEGQIGDQEFHATILQATENPLLINLSASIGAAVRWTTYFKFRGSKTPRDMIEEHRRLFEAITNRDPAEARIATIDLVEKARAATEAALRV